MSETSPLVLVVDDRQDVAETLADICHDAGYRTCIASHGEAIRDMLSHHRPQAVLLDILMPERDGFEALQEIAQLDPALPVLLISGAGESWLRMGESLARARGLEVIHTAAKPVSVAVIRRFLSGSIHAAP